MKYTILGGGLAGVSLAYFLQDCEEISEIEIIEKDDVLGGICRSFEATNKIKYDVGPHIIFSKDKEILDFMNQLLLDNENLEQHRRSNRIIHKEEFVQYPFENDLSKLPSDDIEKCVNGFLNNPYENYEAKNMLHFFLKTFGEGITNIYLRPYNEKIWKFDPSFMDTQMVDRIPKPPKEDIIKSANGETIDGYTHQLYFTYPKEGGIQSLFDALVSKLDKKVKITLSQEVKTISNQINNYIVQCTSKKVESDKIVSTVPVNILANTYNNIEKDILESANSLKYNSIIIAIANINYDKAGDNFAFMVADKEIIFHRLSKLDFMGGSYHEDGTATYLIEITYRKDDLIDNADDTILRNQIAEGLLKIGFCQHESEINFIDLKRFEYAYVVYDLEHRNNMDKIIKYFDSEGILLNGRFGEFEYLNMDAVLRHSLDLANSIKQKI
jgi:protoporphyrinogen oxidase